jgi:hypothetical protein
MDIWKLFFVALMPVLKVLLLTAVGVFLAIERVGILGADARNHLNNVSICLVLLLLSLSVYIYTRKNNGAFIRLREDLVHKL